MYVYEVVRYENGVYDQREFLFHKIDLGPKHFETMLLDCTIDAMKVGRSAEIREKITAEGVEDWERGWAKSSWSAYMHAHEATMDLMCSRYGFEKPKIHRSIRVKQAVSLDSPENVDSRADKYFFDDADQPGYAFTRKLGGMVQRFLGVREPDPPIVYPEEDPDEDLSCGCGCEYDLDLDDASEEDGV